MLLLELISTLFMAIGFAIFEFPHNSHFGSIAFFFIVVGIDLRIYNAKK